LTRHQSTTTRAAILNVIRAYTATHGYPPTQAEIGAAVGLTGHGSVQAHLDGLERAGQIRRGFRRVRSVEVVQ